jgi:TfoX/Sxy family transcriptional regulator of competence genes
VAYDEGLAERVRDAAAEYDLRERKMFGGLAFMAHGNMAACVLGDGLLVRLAPDEYERAVEEEGAQRFGMAGKRPMRGFVLVADEQLADDASLGAWVERGVAHALTLPPK